VVHLKGNAVSEPISEVTTEVNEDTLIEDVSIDGMCGVY
jgi:mycofactocin precursor